MDILYTYRHDPLEFMRWPTLIHSINSMRTYGHGFDRIFISSCINPLVLGIRGVIWLPIQECEAQDSFDKEKNIWSHIANAIGNSDISSPFLWMTDDSFAVGDFDEADIALPRYDGFLRDVPDIDLAMWPLLKRTAEVFPEGRNFVCHTPVALHSRRVMDVFTDYGPLQVESCIFNSFDSDALVADDFCVQISAKQPLKKAREKMSTNTRFINVSEGVLDQQSIHFLLGEIYGA